MAGWPYSSVICIHTFCDFHVGLCIITTYCVSVRVHRAAKRACNYVDGIVLIVTKFRPYPLRVSVYFYVYSQIFCARILFLVTLSAMPSVYALSKVACPLTAFGGSMRPWYHTILHMYMNTEVIVTMVTVL